MYALRECGESGEGAPGNADRSPEKLGSNVDRRPKEGIFARGERALSHTAIFVHLPGLLKSN